MRTRSKILLATLTGTVFLSFVIGTASARRLQLSNQRFLKIWTLVSFEVPGTLTVSCPVTLEGSFHSATLSKLSGQLIGYITRATIKGERLQCNNTGTATVLSETLPWHVRYDRFIGALPSILEIRQQIIGARFAIEDEGLRCLAGTTAANPLFGNLIRDTANGRIIRLRVDASAGIPLSGEFICAFAGNGHVSGTAEMFLLGSLTTRIVATLVQ